MTKEPIAVVGMACRFPGGCDSPEAFWRILLAGSDLITEVGPERWSTDYYWHPDRAAPGKAYTRAAGQIEDVFGFDPHFFGISPREATQMDPQQRLLLELAWEALEDGGQLPGRLAGSNCSVYVGISSTDHRDRHFDDPSIFDGYSMTGNTLSIAANRISYVFDLHGPSMAIDTACSSSLVAVHQACLSLWSGESDTALAGTAHLLLSPLAYIGFSKASMLSPNGRCRVFDADADGYARSEGGGALFLKPLSRAEADGDPVHAVILGSAVNTDGRNKGLTAPSGEAQEALLSAVYRDAGIDATRIAYVEAHGTGTPVGDPVEAGAIGRAIGHRRPREAPIPIGSVKTNVGHLEPASGIAGMLKVILALKKRTLPPSIHLEQLNPDIDVSTLNLRIVRELTPLPAGGAPLVMGVNSFGFGGSNAHAIVGEYARAPAARPQAPPPAPLLLSAATPTALQRRARQLSEHLRAAPTPQDAYDVLYTAGVRRQRLAHGLAVAGGYAEIADRLAAFAEGERPAGVVTAELVASHERVAFAFSGNGSQWAGMGAQLLEDERFREVVERIDALFRPLAGWSLVAALAGQPRGPDLARTEIAQPALFAVQAGVLALLRDRGVAPDAVVGHSVGEIAAAYAAGALSLEQAVAVVYHRSAAQAATKGQGRMVAAQVPEAQARTLLEDFPELELAGVNGPGSVTVAGPTAEIRRLLGELEDREVACKLLDLDYAFHSRLMDPVKDRFLQALGPVTSREANVAFVSTVEGDRVEGRGLDAAYWWDNLRRPVQFSRAVETLIEMGCGVFVEIGPHPVLRSYLREGLRAQGVRGAVIETLRRETGDEPGCLTAAVHRAYLSSPRLAFAELFPVPGACVSLPPYPWDKDEYRMRESDEASNTLSDHPLLGCRLRQVDYLWQNQIDLLTHPFLADHVVDGVTIFPAAAFVEMALAACDLIFPDDRREISQLEIRRPLVFEDRQTKDVQFSLHPESMRFAIRSRDRLSGHPWVVHAVGRAFRSAPAEPTRTVDLTQLRASSATRLGHEALYERASALGLDYGPAFRRVQTLWMRAGEAAARVDLPPRMQAETAYRLHPTVLDAAFHTLLPAIAETMPGIRSAMVPAALGSIRLHGSAETIEYCRCEIRARSRETLTASFALLDADGRVVAEANECRFRPLPERQERDRGPGLYAYHQVPMNRIDPGAVSPLGDLERLKQRVTGEFAGSAPVRQEELFDEQILPLYDALASSLAQTTLREMGAHLDSFTVDSLLFASGISSDHAQFVTYLLTMLQEDGKATVREGRWKLRADTGGEDPDAIWRALVADYPRYLPDMLQSAEIGFRLTDHLLSRRAAEETGEHREHRLTHADPYALHTDLVHRLVHDIVAGWPGERRRLRIARVIGDAPTITRRFTSLLPKSFCDLEILSGDDMVRSHLEQQFRDLPHVTVQELSLSEDGIGQQFPDGQFDLVIAEDLSHCADNIINALSGLGRILGSGGLLLLSERRPNRLTDLNMGIDPKWWARGIDPHRPVSRLLNAEEWVLALERAGFASTTLLTEDLCAGPQYYVLGATCPRKNTPACEPSPPVSGRSWLVVCDETPECNELAALMARQVATAGIRLVTVTLGERYAIGDEQTLCINPDRPGDFRALARHLEGTAHECEQVLFLAGLFPDNSGSADSGMDAQAARCLAACHLVEAVDGGALEPAPRVWLASAGAAPGASTASQRSRGPAGRPEAACLWGLGRVLANEYPHLDCRMIDIQMRGNLAKMARAVVEELTNPDDEDEVILYDDARAVTRLERLPAEPAGPSLLDESVATLGEAVRLAFDHAGNLHELHWTRAARRKPRANEVEIQVKATGLNFRDVMYAAGALPEEMLAGGYAGSTLGLECAGVVAAVGNDVQEFEVGDEVIGFAPSCLSSHVLAPATAVLRKPPAWSFAEAATIPIAFFTACYALEYLAKLEEGERVLIHGAAGGVGLAALQIAHGRGAEIFATAGTPAKRRFLRLLGIEHVFDSRSLDFADEIMAVTGGGGVDIVLNSLAGQAVDKSLSILRPFGRFLELGKRDYLEDKLLGLRPFRNNIAYYGVDVDQLMAERPAFCRGLLEAIMAGFTDGRYRPLAHTVFSACDVADAFKHMQQSRHIGKVVISLDQRTEPMTVSEPAREYRYRLEGDATYLVTGGLGGFGLATARWMADNGAAHIVLLGRHGAREAGAREGLMALRATGVDVRVMECDVTDPVKLQRVLRDIGKTSPPLRGIVHGAMVLDDRPAREMTAESMHRVMSPKVRGAWNLHQLTAELPLDFFVLYSSATTYLGNPAQANYVAANAYLESLARYRRRLGLPATAVAWDAITDAGYLARNPKLLDSLSRLGLEGITTARALQALERVLAGGHPDVAVMKPNWKAVKRLLPIGTTPKLGFVTHAISHDDLLMEGYDLREALKDRSPQEVDGIVREVLTEEIARILQLSTERIEYNARFQDMGVDSLMAMELVTAVEERFGVEIPVLALSSSATLEALAQRIVSLLMRDTAPAADEGTAGAETIASLARRHEPSMTRAAIDKLSDELGEASADSRMKN